MISANAKTVGSKADPNDEGYQACAIELFKTEEFLPTEQIMKQLHFSTFIISNFLRHSVDHMILTYPVYQQLFDRGDTKDLAYALFGERTRGIANRILYSKKSLNEWFNQHLFASRRSIQVSMFPYVEDRTMLMNILEERDSLGMKPQAFEEKFRKTLNEDGKLILDTSHQLMNYDYTNFSEFRLENFKIDLFDQERYVHFSTPKELGSYTRQVDRYTTGKGMVKLSLFCDDQLLEKKRLQIANPSEYATERIKASKIYYIEDINDEYQYRDAKLPLIARTVPYDFYLNHQELFKYH